MQISYSVQYIIPEEMQVGGEIKHLWSLPEKKKALHFILNSGITDTYMDGWIF